MEWLTNDIVPYRRQDDNISLLFDYPAAVAVGYIAYRGGRASASSQHSNRVSKATYIESTNRSLVLLQTPPPQRGPAVVTTRPDVDYHDTAPRCIRMLYWTVCSHRSSMEGVPKRPRTRPNWPWLAPTYAALPAGPFGGICFASRTMSP